MTTYNFNFKSIQYYDISMTSKELTIGVLRRRQECLSSISFPLSYKAFRSVVVWASWNLAETLFVPQAGTVSREYCLESSGNGAVTEGHAQSHSNSRQTLV